MLLIIFNTEPLTYAMLLVGLEIVGLPTFIAKERQIRKPKSGLANLPEAIQPVNTRDELATMFGVSARNILKVRNIIEDIRHGWNASIRERGGFFITCCKYLL